MMRLDERDRRPERKAGPEGDGNSGVAAADSGRRAELLEALRERLGRDVSDRTVLWHQAIADRLGLNATDHKCLGFMCRVAGEGGRSVTPRELADLTGLTSGAITGVIDRLERAGFVRREPDPDDRRQVLVRVEQGCTEEIGKLFEHFKQGWTDLCSRYTEEELELISHFMRETSRLMERETRRLRDAAERRMSARS